MQKQKAKRIYAGIRIGKKKLAALTAVFVMLAGIFGISFPVSAADDFSLESRESVAVVYTCLELNAGEYGFGWGTGFFVGKTGENPKYLVTNYHVISDYIEYGSGELISGTVDDMQVQGRSKIRVYYDSADYEEAYLVSGDESKDIAILKLGAATSKRKPIALCSPTDALVGSTVYAVGYPGLAENAIAGSTTSWGIEDASVNKGTVNRIFTTEGTGRVNLQIDCTIRHGNSGGPLLNGNGAVVGVNTWSVNGTNGDADMYYAVSIDEAILLLNQSGVEYTMAGEYDETGENGGTDGENIDGIDSITQPVPASAGTNTGLIVAVAVMAVIIVVGAGSVAFIVIRNKKAKSHHRQSDSRVQLIAVGGYLNGRTYPVDGSEITFGRDAAATVRFPADAKGVSRQHCRLFWQNGTLMLMDSGSSYGTYTQTGKLQPMHPVAVKSGDVFYIGEKKNCFKVETVNDGTSGGK